MVRSTLQELCEIARSCSGVALPIAGISLSITNFGMDVFSSNVRARRKTRNQASSGHYVRKREAAVKGVTASASGCSSVDARSGCQVDRDPAWSADWHRLCELRPELRPACLRLREPGPAPDKRGQHC